MAEIYAKVDRIRLVDLPGYGDPRAALKFGQDDLNILVEPRDRHLWMDLAADILVGLTESELDTISRSVNSRRHRIG